MPIKSLLKFVRDTWSSLVISLFQTKIWPLDGRSKPPISISRDDFPEPDGPTSATASPCKISKFTSFRIGSKPALVLKERLMFLSSRNGLDIDRKVPLNFFVMKNNMWDVFRKTSIFFNSIVMVSFLLLYVGLKFTNAEENHIKKIAVIGDSLTQGYGLMPQNNLVSQLQKRMRNDNYSIELLNYGVSGDTTAGGLARFDWAISSNVSGVIIILGGNDLLRGIPPEHSYRNLRDMLIKAHEKDLSILLVGLKASANFGSDYKNAFDNIYERLRVEFELFYYENFFKALGENNPKLFLSYMQSDGMHPTSDGIKKIVDDFYPTFQNFARDVLKIN